MIALSLGHQNYIMNIVVILDYLGKTRFYKDWKKPLHYKTVHRWFFEITVALFAVLLLLYGSKDWASLAFLHEHPISFLLVLIIIFVHIEILFRFTWKKAFDDRERFIKERHEDFWEKLDDC